MPAAAAVLAVTESSYFYSYGKQTTAMMTMTVDDEGNPTHSCSAATLGGVPSRSGTRGPNGKRLLPVSLHGNTEHWQAVALHTDLDDVYPKIPNLLLPFTKSNTVQTHWLWNFPSVEIMILASSHSPTPPST
uniref:(northern house mosquito) hypothetical protein n=1 Tax=Culex pipiens TaxID=7175 RepID=A0A8D8MPI6_CULPI